MKKLMVREVETLKTTASMYGCWCEVEPGVWVNFCESIGN